MNAIEEAVRAAKRPMALTGAGISAPSGIPTFQGTWKGEPIRDFLSREYFARYPLDFLELFCEMVSWCDKEPNAAHYALARLNIPVVTQNIDGLHEKAGTKTLYRMHGTLSMIRCPRCGRTEPSAPFAARMRPLFASGDRAGLEKMSRCPCGARWDTDVVLYGDAVRDLEESFDLAGACDLMLVVGTSLTTYPAAALPDVARKNGARVIEVNDDCVGAFAGIGA